MARDLPNFTLDNINKIFSRDLPNFTLDNINKIFCLKKYFVKKKIWAQALQN